MARLVLLHDWETTGLTLHPDADIRKQPRAIEFGGVVIDCDAGGEVVETASLLINPGVPLEAVITKITGLTDADLADAPPFAEVLPQLRRLYGQCRGIVAHNLTFDRQILRGELARLDVTDFPWPERELCTMGTYTEHWGRPPKLKEVYEWAVGKPLEQTHRALDDVLAMAEVFRIMQLWRYM
jgi:DNA polymerase III epsilon subunit-like protein